jgi:5'-methylthioadenosine phosphorylase
MVKLAVIGGTGLYELAGLEDTELLCVETPFGAPSAPVSKGRLGELELFFLARHGVGHVYLPEEINYRANIYALKKLGVTHAISVCAVGSLQPHIKPGDSVVIDQFFDRTRKQRDDTFFGDGLVAHVQFGDPACPELNALLAAAAQAAGATVHTGGTCVTMEGPAFSTRAESVFYKDVLKAAVIGMTSLTEAKLAREAEMCYACLAQVTDYDCWHVEEGGVTVEQILAVMRRNTETAAEVLKSLTSSFYPARACACAHALKHALMTAWDAVPRATIERLRPLIAAYLPAGS